jgi:hypothetical protein
MRELNFSGERKLATTTGGEPVQSDAREASNGRVHEADFTTPPNGMQTGKETADPSAPSCMWFSLGRTTYVVGSKSGEVGNPGTLGMTKESAAFH